MKLKIFIFAIIISLIASKSITSSKRDSLDGNDSINKSEEKQGKANSKKLRSGSMKDGFILPGFYLVNLNNLKATQNEVFISPNTKFNAKQVEDPTTEYEKIGIVFNFEKFDSTLSNIMIRIGNSNQYYLPYRYIKSNPIYKDSWLFWKNKSIELILMNDNNESFSFNIVFPFKLFGNYIEDSEAIRLASKISQRKDEIIMSLKNSLIELRKRSNTLSQKTNLVENLSGEINTITQKKKDLSEQYKKLSENSVFIQSEITKNVKLMEQVKLQLLTLEQNIEGLRSQLTSNDLEIKANKELSESLSTNDKQGVISKTQEELVQEKIQFKETLENLKLSIPEKNEIIKNMNYDSKVKIQDFSKNVEDFLLKITPRIDVTKVKKK